MLDDPDLEDLATTVHLVNASLTEQGFGSQLLRSAVQGGLPVEADLQRWFPLWGSRWTAGGRRRDVRPQPGAADPLSRERCRPSAVDAVGHILSISALSSAPSSTASAATKKNSSTPIGALNTPYLAVDSR